ncbi:MAG: hypothetical protein R3C99_17710 [Pirellulaceae bacterium]
MSRGERIHIRWQPSFDFRHPPFASLPQFGGPGEFIVLAIDVVPVCRFDFRLALLVLLSSRLGRFAAVSSRDRVGFVSYSFPRANRRLIGMQPASHLPNRRKHLPPLRFTEGRIDEWTMNANNAAMTVTTTFATAAGRNRTPRPLDRTTPTK